MWCQNFSCIFCRFVTKHVCDGRTDGQTELRSPRPRYKPVFKTTCPCEWNSIVLVLVQRVDGWLYSTEFSSNSLYKQCDESCMAIYIYLVRLSRLSASSGMSYMMAIVSKSTSLPKMIWTARRRIASSWSRCSAVILECQTAHAYSVTGRITVL